MNEKTALEIIECYSGNMKFSKVCEKFGISKTSLSDLIKGRTWKNLPRPEWLSKKERVNYLPALTERQVEIINGSMLGDGSIKGGFKNSYFRKTQCVANREYVDWIFNEFNPYSSRIAARKSHGILHDKDRRIIGRDKSKIHESCEFCTISHPIFTELDKRWYLRDCDGKFLLDKHGWKIKIVPMDLILTPLAIAIWACDDGSNNLCNRTFRFCTNSFSIREVEFLKDQLRNKFDIISNIYMQDKIYPILTVRPKSARHLIDLISPYIKFECFSYKIDLTAHDARGYR